MRKPFIAGNWKMNMLTGPAATLARAVAEAAKGLEVEVGIAPPFTALAAVAGALKGSGVRLMGQNLHFEDSGAFTGEVSAPMLKDLGCSHVIVAHSERRQFFGETDESANKKLKAAFKQGLTPVYCVGESLAEREAKRTLNVVERQMRGGLAGLGEAEAKTIVIAYEPVWAIGTGKVATPAQAQEVHAYLRKLLAELFGQDLAAAVRIQYGGSVKPDNVKELMSMPDIDGALVGGASLKAESFIPLMKFKG